MKQIGLVSFLCLIFIFPRLESQLVINEIMPSNASLIVDPDFYNYPAWIEIYNKGVSVINISGYYLTDNAAFPTKWVVPSGTSISPGAFLTIYCDKMNTGLHTNFKLDSDGEFIGLYDASIQVIDSLTFAKQFYNHSFGRNPDGGAVWTHYSTPTPKKANSGDTYLSQTAKPLFSKIGGMYSGTIKIGLSNVSPTAKIYFTVGGYEPSDTSTLYTDSISISTTTIIRARAYDSGTGPSALVSQSYFFNVQKDLPVLSLSIDPRFMWDDSLGIYVIGTNGVTGPWDPIKKNFYREWERAANIEMFNQLGTQVFNIGTGVQISGNYTRSLPQKSLDINLDAKYGPASLKYPLFSSKPNVTKFTSFFLRCSGNDWKYTSSKWRGCMFKDALVHSLTVGQMNIDYQAYQPAVLYINGQYWGIHNIREKLNENYIQENHPLVNTDSVDMIKQGALVPWEPVMGDTIEYNRFLNFILTHNMSEPDNYAYIVSQMDIRNFINYQIIETYACNNDWPGNNQKEWREKRIGKWRWMLYDTDPAMASTLMTGPELNMMDISYGDASHWPSAVIAGLSANKNFKEEFAQTYAAHLVSTFDAQRVIAITDSLAGQIELEIPFHVNRWKNEPEAIPSVTQWQTNVNLIKDFAGKRPTNALQHLKSKMGFYTTYPLNLEKTPLNGGTVYIQGVPMPEIVSGTFFNKPISFEAAAAQGYFFVRWEIENDGIKYNRFTSKITDTITGIYKVKAIFSDGQNLSEESISHFSAYPNPVSDYLHIENNGDDERYMIELISSEGMILHSETILGINHVTLNVSAYSTGMYLLRITSDEKSETFCIFKL